MIHIRTTDQHINAALVGCRLVQELYAYETPSTSRNFAPNFFVDITDYIDLKLKAVKIHSTQGGKGYMADRAVKGSCPIQGI